MKKSIELKSVVENEESEQSESEQSESEQSESEHDTIEITAKDKKASIRRTIIEKVVKNDKLPKGRPKLIKTKKVLTDAELENKKEKLALQMVRARAVCKKNRDEAKENKKKDSEVLSTLLEKELGDAYTSSISYKRMETKLKKEILQKLKQKKITELKLKYNYKSDAESSDSNESEDEKPIKKVHKSKAKTDDTIEKTNTRTPVLQYIRDFGF
jgi:hypothetical protein